MDNPVSEEIQMIRGVRQGDPISSKLSTTTVQEVFEKAHREEKEVHIDGEKNLSDLRFAYDVALTTEDVKDNYGTSAKKRERRKLKKKKNVMIHKEKTNS